MSSTEPQFWEKRYLANQMPWDMRGVPAALGAFLAATAEPGSVLIPGCGSGYEIQAFRRHGWNVVAIDFAPAAVDRARALLGRDAACVRHADFFTDDFGGAFDLIYERTFLCALPPRVWPQCIRRAAELLKPGGAIAGIFAYGDETEPGPPFFLSPPVANALFGGQFRLASDAPVPAAESLPLFAGHERWQVWRRR